MTTLAFDLETQMLASEVEREFTDDLAGTSAWSQPDLFGFACGVAVNIESGGVTHYGPGEVSRMLEALRGAETTVGYNSSAFDLVVLSAYGDVEVLRERHVDLCAVVRDALEALRAVQAPDADRLRQGGLDGLARANDLQGKGGDGLRAVELFRAGRFQELLDYCEADARLAANLYRMSRGSGGLRVDPYYRDKNQERIYLPRTTLPLDL